MKVALLCTGKMELGALGPALKRLFPQHEFTAIPKRGDIPNVDREPFDEFTTAKVEDAVALNTGSILRSRLVPALARVLFEGYDLAVLLSDLELANQDRARNVCDIVQRAVLEHVKTLKGGVASTTTQALRERASFHLAVPMAESWLFGDPALCLHNQVPPGRMPQLVKNRDREQFMTDDQAYETDNGASCIALLARANQRARPDKRRRQTPDWVTTNREMHPKHYLQWLCRDPSENSCTTWRETQQGTEALRQLNWQAVLSAPDEYAFLHAFVEDLADAFNEPEPFMPTQRIDVPTRVRPIRARMSLRNAIP